MEWRLQQQLKIFALLFIPFLGLGAFIIWKSLPAPTCFDGKLNQQEEKIDCGGPYCASCKILAPQDINQHWIKFLPSGKDIYDVVVELTNPNFDHGAAKIDYEIKLLDANLLPVASRRGSTFLLPQQTRHVVEVSFSLVRVPKFADFSVSNIEWVKRESIALMDSEIITTKREFLSQGSNGRPKITVEMSNFSPYKYSNVLTNILALDDKGNVLAASRHISHNIDPDENFSVEAVWNTPFLVEPASIVVEPAVNAFDPREFSLPK